MPVFEGLLPPKHDELVQTLLFHLAEWQSLAKLRLHTEDTLALLRQALRRLGAQARKFQRVTCQTFDTKELPQESAARCKREMADMQSGQRRRPPTSGALPKTFNINTYKFHALGDYDVMIHQFGTTDSYSMRVVCVLLVSETPSRNAHQKLMKGERAHKFLKRVYRSSNKKDIVQQFAKQERRGTLLRRQLGLDSPELEKEHIDRSPQVHHSMAKAPRRDNIFDLPRDLQEHQTDPAVKAKIFLRPSVLGLII